MPGLEEDKQTRKSEPEAKQGCPVLMFNLQRCGRPLYQSPVTWRDAVAVCVMHSRDPSKSNAEFQKEFERTLAVAGDGIANFAGFVFPSASYGKRTFLAKCIFNQATFTGVADFMGATFTEPAIFSEAVFFARAYFLAATFMKDAVFAWAKFIHGADFSMVQFMQDAKFHEATFAEDANFSGVKFGRDAYFNSAIFIGNVYFNLIRPTMAAESKGITNKNHEPKRFPFIPAAFLRKADFRDATFSERAEFRQTRFREDGVPEPGPVFSLARFDKPKHVAFYDTYLGQALFHNCDASEFLFTKVRWRQRDNGKRMVFDEDERLKLDQAATIALLPEAGSVDERNYGLIEQLYQQLKKNYDARCDYCTGGDFHYGEMEMKRLACPRLTSLSWLQAKLSGNPRFGKLGEWCGKLQSSPWLLSKLRWSHQHFGLAAWYRRASDYGESWGKPLLWLFAVLVLFAALYPLLGLRPAAGRSPAAKTMPVQVEAPLPQETNLRYWNYERPGRLFCHSVMTSLGVAAFQRDLAYEPSYPWGRLLALFELLLTSTLIALFLLAIRRQFRR
jgi:uncharacterized protein YjbI with pentapeptide repeats